MKDNQLKTLIKYRIDQSKETLNDANILYKKDSYRGTVNRAYYSMFYSVLCTSEVIYFSNCKKRRE